MRNMMLAAVAALSISLGGCATTGGSGGLPNAQDLLAQVQAYAQQACGFLPLVDNSLVQTLLLAYFPQGVSAAQAVSVIGGAICAGTGPKAVSRKAGALSYKMVRTPRGTVRVPGRYVR